MNTSPQFSTFLGIIIAFALVIISIVSGQGDPIAFVDLKSIMIVLGGTFFITSACYTIGDVLTATGVTLRTMFYRPPNLRNIAQKCLFLSEVSKKEGILKLQSYTKEFPDSKFFTKHINLAIDGIKAPELEVLMENEINSTSATQSKTVDILRKGSEVSPAMGLIGTLIGLVQMLGSLEDPTKIGPAMALALLTTMYGAILAYMVFLPLASKLERTSRQEFDLYVIFGEAIISIAKNEGPMKLEMKLNSTLPPGSRLRNYSE